MKLCAGRDKPEPEGLVRRFGRADQSIQTRLLGRWLSFLLSDFRCRDAFDNQAAAGADRAIKRKPRRGSAMTKP
jgi:hypothetical protein